MVELHLDSYEELKSYDSESTWRYQLAKFSSTYYSRSTHQFYAKRERLLYLFTKKNRFTCP